MFKVISQNFAYKKVSIFGIKLSFITPEYKELKKLFRKVIVKDFGNNNRVILTGSPCVEPISGGGDADSLRISFFGDNNTIVIARSAKLSGMINIFGENNSISVGELSNVHCTISIGNENDFPNNSRLCFGEHCKISKFTLDLIEGSNQIMQFGNYLRLLSVHVILYDSAKLLINDNTTIGGDTVMYCCPYSSIIIDEDCMFSSNIVFWTRDGHTIIDKASGRIVNDTKNNNIHIGKHCWIGYGVTLLKNVTIPDNSIVGMNSFVINKQFDEQNVIIAGSPAKVIKRNIDWDRDYASLGRKT